MSTSFIDTSSGQAYSSTSVSASAPAGTLDDDLMLAVIFGINGPSATPPSGWTHIAGLTAWRLFYKVASSEAGFYAFTQPSVGKMRVQIASYRGGFDVANPIDSYSSTLYVVNNTELRAASFSVAAANSTIIFAGGSFNTGSVQTFSPPTNPGTFTEDVDDGDATSDCSMTFASYLWSSSGSTGNISATISSSSTTKHAFAVALNPAQQSPVYGIPRGLLPNLC